MKDKIHLQQTIVSTIDYNTSKSAVIVISGKA